MKNIVMGLCGYVLVVLVVLWVNAISCDTQFDECSLGEDGIGWDGF